jgi:hypothetical protein
VGGACSVIEYGDTVDVMGGSSSGHYNAFQKERLGWLNHGSSPPITAVETDGTYWIDGFAAAGTGPKALKIPRHVDALGRTTWYYVEYRQPFGFDGYLSGNTNVRTGVVVHSGSEASANSSDLLDMTPTTSSWSDPALGVDRAFTDPDSGLRMVPVVVNGGSAAVSVTFATPGCVRVAPTLSLSPAQSPWVAPGTAVTFTAVLTSNDGAGCSSSTFALSATVPAGWGVVTSPASLTLGSGAVASASVVVTSPATAPEGFVPIPISASRGAGATDAATGSVTYVVSAAGGGTFTDTFDRPDSTILGNGWVEIAGNLMISGHRLGNGGAAGESLAVLPALIGPDEMAAADFTAGSKNAGPRFGVVLRYQDPDNYYLLSRKTGGASRLVISRVVAGRETVLKSVAVPNPVAGRAFRLTGRARGATLTLELDGVPKASATDGRFPTGSVGVFLGSAKAAPHWIDGFSASAQ